MRKGAKGTRSKRRTREKMKMKDGSEERRAKMEESLSVESNQKGKSRHLKSRRPHFHSELATHLSNTCTLTKTSLQTAYT